MQSQSNQPQSINQPTVWVVQDNGRNNLLLAQRWGTIKTLLPARLQIQHSAAEAIDAIDDKLSAMGEEDSILAAGDPAAIGIATAIAAFYNNGIVNMLKFDRMAEDYYRVSIDLSSFFTGSETLPLEHPYND